MITYTYDEKSDTYTLTYENGLFMGYLYKEIDGFYVWQQAKRSGYLSSHILLSIGNYLEHLNKDWLDKVENDS